MKTCSHPTCSDQCRREKKAKVRKPLPKKKAEPISKLKAKAEKVFNNYIRQRDKNLGCISCGGNVDHAGHYMSAGQNSALRFNELNVNGQCVGCNCFKHGNLVRYRQGLIDRRGEEVVKELEGPTQLKKWTREELKEIIHTYGFIKK